MELFEFGTVADKYTRLFTASNNQDGTGREWFGLFGGVRNENGTVKNKEMTLIMQWQRGTERDLRCKNST